MPTRLVEVGTHDAPTVRLRRTNGIHAPYLTLSHCWGNADIKKRTTEGDFDIPLEQLPRTFQDAVTVTRRLGFTYLWIDSLCIIQGDGTDWEHESAHMASVYANGTLNLAASCSIDSYGGLMLERNQLQVTSCYWEHDSEPISSRRADGSWMEAGKVCWTFDPQSEFDTLGTGKILPLRSRGWVLQENVLSPRTLHFLPGEIIWECRGVLARESCYDRNQPSAGPSHEFSGRIAWSHIPVIQNGLKTFSQPLFNNRRPDEREQCGLETTSSASSLETQNQPYHPWYELVTQYCQKDLTKPDDRFPAIWALAERFQQMTGDEYCAGLWRNDILTGLLFKRSQLRPPKPHASLSLNIPSWSWAAIESRVEFECKSSPSSVTPANSPRLSDARIQRILLIPLDSVPFPMGRTTQAELEIRTYTQQMVGHHLNSNPSPKQRAAKILGISWIGSDVGRIYEDLEREYELHQGRMYSATHRRPLMSPWQGLNSKDRWIRSRAQKRYGNGESLPGRFVNGSTDCYFGWSGTRHKASALWEQQQKEIQRSEKNKILNHSGFELDFDSLDLAYRYAGKPVLCLHIRGTSGLLVELDTAPQKYRRIGVYRRDSSHRRDDLSEWEETVVTLI